MKPANEKRFNIFFAVIFMTLLTIGIIAWEMMALPYSDDWFYMHTYTNRPGAGFLQPGEDVIVTTAQAADSFMRHYVDFGSRLTHLFVYFSYLLPTWLTDIFDGTAIGCMLAMIAVVSCGKNGLKSPVTLTAVASLMWLVLPWGDNMVSHDYQINYVWSSLPTLYFLYLYLYKAKEPESNHRNKASGVIAAFFAGAMHEGLALPVICASLIVYIAEPEYRRRRRAMLATLAIGVALCIGPGTLNRMFYGKEVTFEIATYQYLISRSALALLPWIVPATAFAAVSLKRGKASAWKIIKSEWPWLLIAITNYAMALSVMRMGRTLWMMDLCVIIVTIKILKGYQLTSFKHKTALASVLAAINIGFIAELCHRQRIVSEDQQFSIDMIKSTGCREIYTRLPLQENAPWWTSGIPHRYDGTDDIAQYTLSAAMDSNRGSFYPILPISCKGKPFEDWPKIAGDNPFRGEYPNLYGRDSADIMLTITVGEPMEDMSPVNRLLSLLSGSDMAQHLRATPQILWDGDSGQIYKYSLPTLPRTIKSRRFISLDVEN